MRTNLNLVCIGGKFPKILIFIVPFKNDDFSWYKLGKDRKKTFHNLKTFPAEFIMSRRANMTRSPPQKLERLSDNSPNERYRKTIRQKSKTAHKL